MNVVAGRDFELDSELHYFSVGQTSTIAIRTHTNTWYQQSVFLTAHHHQHQRNTQWNWSSTPSSFFFCGRGDRIQKQEMAHTHTHTHRRKRVNPVETVLFKFGTGLGQKLFTIVSIWIRFLDFIAHRRPAGRQTDVQAGAELGTLPPTDLIAVTVCGDGKLSKGKSGEIRDGTLFFLIIDCEGNNWDSNLKALKFIVSNERNSNLVILYDYTCWKNHHYGGPENEVFDDFRKKKTYFLEKHISGSAEHILVRHV